MDSKGYFILVKNYKILFDISKYFYISVSPLLKFYVFLHLILLKMYSQEPNLEYISYGNLKNSRNTL